MSLVLKKTRRGLESFGTGVRDACEPPCRRWELNPLATAGDYALPGTMGQASLLHPTHPLHHDGLEFLKA